MGIVRMKMLARSYYWWPKIDLDIESFVGKCSVCQQTRKKAKDSSLVPWPKTTYPMERVHLDFFYFNHKTYFLFVDA